MEQAVELLSEAESLGIQAINIFDERYPQALRTISDPPLVLFQKGKLLSDTPRVAIVGSRKCSPYGREIASQIARELKSYGVSIVSGLALGIDAAAHRGAPENGVAILGSGLGQIYPGRNLPLAKLLLQKDGTLLSEYSTQTTPRKHFFLARNRIISGLCQAVIVVEAAKRSGALTTARLAAEQGRDVFAVPGNINSPYSIGTNSLLKDGAAVLTSVNELVESVFGITETTQSSPLPQKAEAKSIFEILQRRDAVHISEFREPLNEVLATLSSLELEGKVYRYPGDYYSLSPFVDIRGCV